MIGIETRHLEPELLDPFLTDSQLQKSEVFYQWLKMVEAQPSSENSPNLPAVFLGSLYDFMANIAVGHIRRSHRPADSSYQMLKASAVQGLSSLMEVLYLQKQGKNNYSERMPASSSSRWGGLYEWQYLAEARDGSNQAIKLQFSPDRFRVGWSEVNPRAIFRDISKPPNSVQTEVDVWALHKTRFPHLNLGISVREDNWIKGPIGYRCGQSTSLLEDLAGYDSYWKPLAYGDVNSLNQGFRSLTQALNLSFVDPIVCP